MSIHQTAIVSVRAELAEGVRVGPYAIIGDDVVLHEGVDVGPHVVIEGPSEIGRDTRLFPFAYVGQAPQDIKFKGERSRLVIGKRNTIREYATMHRGTEGGGGITSIGDDNLFMAQSHIAHDCNVGSHCIFANGASLAGHVEVADHATLGALAGVHQFCNVGAHAYIGAHSVVVKDALPFALTVGDHARCYGANSLGLRRKGFSNESIRLIQHAFHLLLASKLNTSQALEQIKSEMAGAPEIDYLIGFIEGSKRGVVK